MKTSGRWVWILLTLGLVAAPAAAERAAFYKELMLIGGYSEEEEWVGGMHDGQKNAAGFEYLRKFGGDRGDQRKCWSSRSRRKAGIGMSPRI